MATENPCDGIKAPEALSYFTAVTSAFLSVFTIFGNCLILFAIIKDPFKKLRTPFMFILFSLAMSDLVTGAITLPTSVVTHSKEALGIKSSTEANIIRYTYFVSSTASLIHLAVLGVDRCLAVTKAVEYRARMKFRRCVILTLCIWILSILFPCLLFVVGYMSYLMIFAHASVLTTFIILFVTYIHVYKLLSAEIPALNDRESSAGVSHGLSWKRMEHNVTKAYIFILVCFILCYTPTIISIYILNFCKDCDCGLRHVLRDLQFLCAVSNSSFNPYVCTIRLRPFRQALKEIFKFGKREPKRYDFYDVSKEPIRCRTLTLFSDITAAKYDTSAGGTDCSNKMK